MTRNTSAFSMLYAQRGKDWERGYLCHVLEQQIMHMVHYVLQEAVSSSQSSVWGGTERGGLLTEEIALTTHISPRYFTGWWLRSLSLLFLLHVYTLHVHSPTCTCKLEFPLRIRWYRDTCLALYCLIRPTTTELPR